MDLEEIVEELRRHGLSNGTALGRHLGIADIAADKLVELNDFMNSQRAKLLADLSAAHTRIAELETEVQALRANGMIQEQIIKEGGNPFDKDKLVHLIMEKTALQAKNKEAMEKAKLWGSGLIEGYSDAHVTICAECDFPIPDYGVDEDLQCNWCKAKNRSSFYAPTGPGYCKTTLDRKAETFDKLFCGRRK